VSNANNGIFKFEWYKKELFPACMRVGKFLRA
jgi:hypothetical protein